MHRIYWRILPSVAAVVDTEGGKWNRGTGEWDGRSPPLDMEAGKGDRAADLQVLADVSGSKSPSSNSERV